MSAPLSFLARYLGGRMPFAVYLAGMAVGMGVVMVVSLLPGGPWLRSLVAGGAVALCVFAAVRAAGRLMADTGGTSGGWLLYLAGLALLVFTTSGIIGFFLPPPPPLPWQPPPAKVTLQDGHILLTGPIDYRSLTELRNLLDADGAPQLIILTSDGGHSIAGRSIGLLIAERGRSTRVESHCHSACAIAFAGGVTRSLAADARLGFHRPGIDHKDRVLTIDPQEVAKKDEAFLLDQGVSQSFVDQLLAVPPAELWLPNHQLLRDAGVLTGD